MGTIDEPMNAEVHKIIEHMQKLAPPARVQVSNYDRVHTYQMLNMAHLMVLLAEERATHEHAGDFKEW